MEAASAPQPVAKAEIRLSEEDRQRIAKELGLDESQLDAVPHKLDIARYNDEDLGLDDDVSGVAFTPIGSLQPTTSTLGTLQFGKIPGGLLVPL